MSLVEAQQLEDRNAGTRLRGHNASLAVDRHKKFWMIVAHDGERYEVQITKPTARGLIDNCFNAWQLVEFSDHAVIEPRVDEPAQGPVSL